MNKSGGHYTKRNKPVREGQISHDSTHVTSLKQPYS